MRPVRVVVIDDELPARQRLEDLLAREPDVELVGSHGNPVEAVEALRREPVDLVFLDVQMPELSGLEVVRRVGPERMPATIFVTAYDQYALRAFDLAAIDYLLKPYEDERFEQALARARERVRLGEVESLAGQLRTVLQTAASELPVRTRENESTYLERIAVEARGQRVLVSTREIDYIAAEGAYAELHVGGKVYVIRERMQVLEESLDPDRFCRIHRSTIVNVSRIAALEPLFRGDHILRLRDGTKLRLSRSRRGELARRLGVSI